MNKVTLVGNIVADPNVTLTSNGNEKSSFTIAVRDIRNYQETHFIPCVAWNPHSAYINANVKKGDLVSIDGRLTRRSYTPVSGQTIYVTEVVVDGIETLRRSSSSKTTDTFNVHNAENISESAKQENDALDSTTNLDTVFSNSTYEDNNQDESSDDIDWDSEFN